jgi:hypothetical protein
MTTGNIPDGKLCIGVVDVSNAKGSRPLGWDIIRWFQDSPYVHCFMVYNGQDGAVVYETTEYAFERRMLSSRMSGTPCRFWVASGDVAEAMATSVNAVGSFYDYTGIVGLGVMLAAERLMNWIIWPLGWLMQKLNAGQIEKVRLAFIGNPYHLRSMFFCSESCVEALMAGGVELPTWWIGENVTPRMLVEYMQQHPKVFEEISL